MGWPLGAGIVFSNALSVASAVVLLRVPTGAALAHTKRGLIAPGWLIVEDLATVLMLVLLPPLAPLLSGTATPVDSGHSALHLAYRPAGASVSLGVRDIQPD
jgi:monovalent cation:H+ antiporter-2, CPA2 family